MAILNEAKNPQPRDAAPKPIAPFATGAAIGVGAGTAQPAGVAPRAGAAMGVGGGVAQAAPAAPSGGGGGGAASASPDYSALSQLAGAGLTSADIVALANRGSAPSVSSPVAAPAGVDDSNPFPGMVVSPAAQFGAAPAVGSQDAGIMDPALLAQLALYDQQLNDQISGYRRQQDDAQTSLADAIPELGRQFDINREGVKDSFEGRGLLKSGETEQAVGRTYEDQGRRESQLQKQTADSIANLEQQIAQARIANAIARNSAQNAGAGQQVGGIVGSVA